jgi:hypothetical protein
VVWTPPALFHSLSRPLSLSLSSAPATTWPPVAVVVVAVVYCLSSAHLRLTFGRIVSFFHPSLDSPDTFQVSFSLQYISSPCHSYRRRLCFRLTIELPIVLLRVPVCIWFDVGTRDGRHCRWEMAGRCRRCKCQLMSIIERRAFVVCSSQNDSQSLLEKTEKKTKRKETK